MTGNLPPPLPGTTGANSPGWTPPPLPGSGPPKEVGAPAAREAVAQSALPATPAPKGAPVTPSAASPQIEPAKPDVPRPAAAPSHRAGSRSTLAWLGGAAAAVLVAATGAYFYAMNQQKLALADVERKSAEAAQQIAALTARAEAERKVTEIATQRLQATAPPAHTEPPPTPAGAVPAAPNDAVVLPSVAGNANPLSELAPRFPVDASMPLIRAMLSASVANDDDALERAAHRISELQSPQRGDRKQARRLNDDGLTQLRRNEHEAAAGTFLRAALVDPADPEILGNLAHAHLMAGNYELAGQAATLSLTLTPRRASSWGTLALITVKGNPQAMSTAVAAYRNAYRFAGSQDKAREYLQKLASEGDDPTVQALAERVIADLPSLRTVGSDANRALGR